MAKDPLIFAGHVLEEIAIIRTIVNRHSVETFLADPVAFRAAIFSIQSISEAVRQLPEDWTNAYPHIPWQDIRAIDNRTRHEYYRLDELLLWNAMTEELLPLEVAVAAMVKRAKP